VSSRGLLLRLCPFGGLIPLWMVVSVVQSHPQPLSRMDGGRLCHDLIGILILFGSPSGLEGMQPSYAVLRRPYACLSVGCALLSTCSSTLFMPLRTSILGRVLLGGETLRLNYDGAPLFRCCLSHAWLELAALPSSCHFSSFSGRGGPCTMVGMGCGCRFMQPSATSSQAACS
jgi:hypothetical protein